MARTAVIGRSDGWRPAGVFVAQRLLWPVLTAHRLSGEYLTDRRYGIDTRSRRVLTPEADDENHLGLYEPVAPSSLRRALDRLPIDRSSCTFVDLGCGKGTAVVVVATLAGFGRVVGVELEPELVDSARGNIERIRATRPANDGEVEIVLADAKEYDLPAGPVVVYINNPFGEGILRTVLDRALRSMRADPREMLFLFHTNATLSHVMPDYPAFAPVAYRRGWSAFRIARG